jgi:hypothetical protein
MPILLIVPLILLLTLTSLSAGADVIADLYADTDEMTGYGEPVMCEDDDDNAVPINVIEQRYAAGRMAFLFGQYKVAHDAWVPLAEQGYAKAIASLAWMYHTGNGVEKDIRKAGKLYRQAAEQGHTIAQNNLGVMLENGQLGHVSYTQAAYWYRQAANVGYSYAQYNLGMLYVEGKGVKKDLKKAAYWLRIAARQKVDGANAALKRIGMYNVEEEEPKPKQPAIAHAPYHSNPVTKGIAWIKAQNPDHYTIQLARSKDIDWILALASEKKLTHTLVQFSLNSRGDEWFYLIYGSYPSRDEANKALKTLPKSFEEWSPWVKRIKDVQKQLKDKQVHNTPLK